MRISRRRFLVGASAYALAPNIIGCRKTERPITGSFVNESAQNGHRIRDGFRFAAPTQVIKSPVVIVGGGIAGLSAAWQLDRKGFRDFVLLEMEQEAGGTSRGGRNDVSAFPWAAHYIPVPNSKSLVERELFSELGLLTPDGGWNAHYICRQPQERLFVKERWQEGLHPHVGETENDREQHERFYELIDRARDSGDFTIALEKGASLQELDHISFAEWLREQMLDSPYLNWYCNYACRDDYGATAGETSAWAGIHYFACREDTEDRVFTWPEGNGWVVKQLTAKLAQYIWTGSMVYRIARDGQHLRVFTERAQYIADTVIFAAPTFLAPHMVEGMQPLDRNAWQYSPWLTANVVLEREPKKGKGEGLAWDNVVYDSPALGYVVANHQTGARKDGRMVWTFYWALAEGNPAQNRRLLLEHDWHWWKEAILNDLAKAHTDIRSCVSQVDIMRMGHAMARPSVGAIFNDERWRLAHQSGNLLFANSDLSGFSIFEEAQYHGVEAANRALERLGKQ